MDEERGIASEPEPNREHGTSVYRRRSFALLGTLWGLAAALLWVALPTGLAVAVLLVGGPATPAWAVAWVVGIAAIFVVAGAQTILHGIERIRCSIGDPVLLTVGPGGIWLRDSGLISWTQLARLDTGSIDVIRQYNSRGPMRGRLEATPADAARLRDRSWFAVADQGIRRVVRRLKPFGDRSALGPRFELDLDLLDADPRDVLSEIARYRPTDVPKPREG
jgi:hypothetical protein